MWLILISYEVQGGEWYFISNKFLIVANTTCRQVLVWQQACTSGKPPSGWRMTYCITGFISLLLSAISILESHCVSLAFTTITTIATQISLVRVTNFFIDSVLHVKMISRMMIYTVINDPLPIATLMVSLVAENLNVYNHLGLGSQ